MDTNYQHAAYELNSFSSFDGLKLFYRDYLSADDLFTQASEKNRLPILCLHGLTRNSKDFEPLAAFLAPHFRLIVPDIRGRGLSDYDSDYNHYNPVVYVQDIWSLLDTLAIEKVILIGTSMGGLMSMLMAAEKPQRIAAVVLNDVGPEVETQGLARIKKYVGIKQTFSAWNEVVIALKKGNQDFFPDLQEQDWLAFAKRLFEENDSHKIEADYDVNITRAFSDQQTNLWPLYDALRTIPTMLIQGELSDVLSDKIVHKMVEHKPNLYLVRVPNRGHAPFLDEPVIIDTLGYFLQQVA